MTGDLPLGPPESCAMPCAILALDASSARVSAAFAERVAEAPGERDQAAALVRLAAAVLAGGRPAAVAATVGPGSFTGIRAALALAQGLALGFGVPAVAVSSAEALAAAGEGRVLAAIDSRRGHVFLAGFTVQAGIPAELLPPFVWRPGEPLPAGPWRVVGDAAAFIDPLAAPSWPEARQVARVAAARLAGAIAARPFVPLYVDRPAVRAPAGAAIAC
ncbi:MAG: tRNA (adenosine(37)-N6)-threonylcarbamoyltransferase complex dimerization subunit type 1 TsaB [Elioraea sp.]|nr:tRNA (adenosine(37)-N6)-threonylcarbamoyltransferase complex dimerization subunit type 1 TsaB [Elioraea sp.]